MANFGVILLECETLIKEAQTSRDKQAVLDKAVTDAQALVDRCKAFAGKNKQALMLAKVQEDDVKRKAAVRDEERARGKQMEASLSAKLAELQGMSSSVDAGLKTKFEGLQHRARELHAYHGSASNVPNLNANEIMRLAAATEAKSTAGAVPSLAPPPASRGQSEGLLVSPRQRESVSQPASPAPHHHHPASPAAAAPVTPTHSAPPTPAPAASPVHTPAHAPSPLKTSAPHTPVAPNSPLTRGPMLGTGSPRSATMYGTMRASSAPREPRTPLAAKPSALGNEAPAAAPEVRKTWNQRTSNASATPAKPAAAAAAATTTTKNAPAATTLRVSSGAAPTPAAPASPSVATNPPSPKAALTPEPSSAAADKAPAPAVVVAAPAEAPASTAQASAAPSPSATSVQVPKFNLVVEEETSVVVVKRD